MRSLELASDADPALRGACLDSLRLLGEPRVAPLAVAALGDQTTQRVALRCLEDLGGPDQLGDVIALATRNPDAAVVHQVVRLVTGWSRRAGVHSDRRRELDRAVAGVQGPAGTLAHWQVAGPLAEADVAAVVAQISAPDSALEPAAGTPRGWQPRAATGSDSRLRLSTSTTGRPGLSWLACTELELPEPTSVQFLAAAARPGAESG